MTKSTLIPSCLVLGLLAACSGGGGKSSTPPPPAQASTLAYTNPTTGTYQLVKNAALSTPGSHLVLDLVGPAGTTGCGLSIALTVGSGATWSSPGGTDLVANGGQFVLGSAPQILKAKVTGSTLTATVAEKGLATPKALNAPLLRVALDLQTGLLANTAIPLTAGSCTLLSPTGQLQTIPLTPGTLSAQ